jgi:hypothetical protein
MARLMVGMVLVLLFILSLVLAAAFRPPLSVTLVLLLGVVLVIPGIVLIILGRRLVTLFTKAGGEVIAAARETGRVNIADIADKTQTNPDKIRMVVATLTKKGIIPRDVDIS